MNFINGGNIELGSNQIKVIHYSDVFDFSFDINYWWSAILIPHSQTPSHWLTDMQFLQWAVWPLKRACPKQVKCKGFAFHPHVKLLQIDDDVYVDSASRHDVGCWETFTVAPSLLTPPFARNSACRSQASNLITSYDVPKSNTCSWSHLCDVSTEEIQRFPYMRSIFYFNIHISLLFQVNWQTFIFIISRRYFKLSVILICKEEMTSGCSPWIYFHKTKGQIQTMYYFWRRRMNFWIRNMSSIKKTSV